MNLCITGALGHIGSHLIRNLKIKNLKKIYLVDNLSTQRYCSLFDLPKKCKFSFHQLDINNKKVDSIIKNSDIVIHLAAFTDPAASFKNKTLVSKTNIQGTKNIARLCAEYNKPLLFISTTSVYFPVKKNPNPYTESKIKGEKIIRRLGKTSDLKYTIFRLGTIFGWSIGMRFNTAVNKFVWQAANKQPITIWKTALNQIHPYCGLNDAALAINFVINKQLFNNQVYNIVTLNTSPKKIIKIIKKHIPNIQVQLISSVAMTKSSLEISNLKSKKIGIKYKDSLNEEIKKIIGFLPSQE